MSGRLLILLTAVLWSLSGVVLKSPAFEQLPAEARGAALAGLRAAFATLVLLPLVRPRHVRWRPGLVPMTAAFAAMSGLFISAMLATTAAAAVFLQYTSTVWACLLGWLFLKERPGKPDAVALAFVIIGIAVIIAGDWGRDTMTGNVLALASGLCYAGVVVCLRSLRDEDPAWLTFLNHAVSAAVLLPWLLVRPVSLTATHLSLIAFLGVVQMALPYIVFSVGVRTVPAREAALLLLIEPILNPLWVALAWGGPVPTETWVGGAVILSGLAVRFAVTGRSRPAAAAGDEPYPVPSSEARPPVPPAPSAAPNVAAGADG